jgi:3-deoxy-manno-octulosonate cytidylyltransferase (CMP-KDO synthetase)
MLTIESQIGRKTDIVVMVQGDEPMVTPEMIEQSVAPMLTDPSVQVVNLMARIKTVEEFEDPNEVKVVIDRHSNAIYFSREPIPSRKKGKKDVPIMKQVCIIPFRRDFLLKFNELDPTPLEIIESVDMMRVIEHGYKVKMAFSGTETHSVDTPEDLAKVEKRMENDVWVPQYAE